MCSKNFNYTDWFDFSKKVTIEGALNARQILADVEAMLANDKTNTLTKQIIFGKQTKIQGSELCAQTLRDQRRGG